MAKKSKSTDDLEKVQDIDSVKLSKLLIKELNRDQDDVGKIAWCLATDDDNPTDVKEFISTGSELLDYIIANKKGGGIPVGKVTEISGEEASGKSLLIAHLIAETQRRGGIAAYIDVENSANPEFMIRLGVNINELIYLQPPTVEEVGDVIQKIIVMTRARAPDKLILIAWDSIAATPCKCEIEGDFELGMDLQLAKSRVLSKMMRKITETLGKERIALVFTNQLKTKIGVMYGDPMTTPGGKAVPYHSSVRIRLNAGPKQTDAKTEQIYGVTTTAKIVKNRLGPPWRKCKFDILFSSGIDNVGSWFEMLHEREEILKKEGWCYLTSVPSGKIETDGVNKGKDLGLIFRESKWKEFVESRPMLDKIDMKTGEVVLDEKKKPVKEPFDLKSHIISLIEKHMIVRYGEKPKDVILDPESLMDAESVVETVTNG